MGKIAFVFPGQGSQTVGMGKSVVEKSDQAKSIFESADQRLGYSLSDIIFNGPDEKLTLTTNAQPALLTTSIAILTCLEEAGIRPDYTAGHSLGEYSALVAAGAMDFEDAVFAVHKRGEYMEEAVPNGEGTMAAILGMDRNDLQKVTDEVTANGDSVQLANLNCPGQIVISGTVKGVEKASVLAKEKGAKRALPLQVSGPFHSELMKPAAQKFVEVLDEVKVQDSKIPVIANVTAAPISKASDIKEKLIEQLYSPVLWEDSVLTMLELGVDTFIEIGPGKVLSGLIKKINRNVKTYSVQDFESCQQVVNELKL
ncbi:[acyl-carrier-protein] S-malonyltransferase [Heyndrickxia sporothermodurans]|uniref:Malonyl CoA-acyl carrier protein transacylase n=1 Tax=Heyndrickxia sporothermodurans TaxID=46224 RepID=A0AB37HBI1_9BACI|nr:ACP S-malonyltransferase [Heyndrickxia sporothermodurans]MBL5767915.1 ACP S-malonyltransferase [Heyndrickxia sporothermodurans]MBL5772563.1 ACP S-malonyltransferase [Heyndrickxia sporothermodurans]MBL5775188.1 ACP S-malonyltransferase [Heyndrickxia sporothermodurans]MBL5778628.1 ACP S-malonyltransferase [Heyndrickxia sporothermodurans]MBL5782217.1 ACP S-malonyltransferase [Heyndrickxia sporothermodurans]